MKVCEKVQRKGTTSYNEVADELVAEFSAADNHILPNESVSVCAAGLADRAPGPPSVSGTTSGTRRSSENASKGVLTRLCGDAPASPALPRRAPAPAPCVGRLLVATPPSWPGGLSGTVRGAGGAQPPVCLGSGPSGNPLRLRQAYDQKNIRRRVYDALNVLMAMNIISKEKKEIRWIGLPTNSAQECQNLEVSPALRPPRVPSRRRSSAPLAPAECLGRRWGAGVPVS